MSVPDYVARYLEHAPPAKDLVLDPKIRGWWIKDGYYLCAVCAGRIMKRGGALPMPAEPVWKDRPEPYGVCLGCESPPAENPRPLREGENRRGWPRELVREHAELRLARMRGKHAALGGIEDIAKVRGLQLESADGRHVWIIAKSVRGDHEWKGVAYPWQVSWFGRHEGQLFPWGHENARTIPEAVEIVLRQAGPGGIKRTALANPPANWATPMWGCGACGAFTVMSRRACVQCGRRRSVWDCPSCGAHNVTSGAGQKCRACGGRRKVARRVAPLPVVPSRDPFCTPCGGRGFDPVTLADCPSCEGFGRIRRPFGEGFR